MDVDTGEEFLARPADLDAFVHLLARADELIGHNIAGFDLPLLDRFYPNVKLPKRIFDTIAVSRQQFFTTIMGRTIEFRNAAGRSEAAREARYPKRLLPPQKLHNLESWGFRLQFFKDTMLKDLGVQEEFTEELLQYCLRDVQLAQHLYHWLRANPGKRGWPVPEYEAMVAESQFTYLITKQELNGVGFDEEAAGRLYSKLAGRRAELEVELKKFFPAWWAPKPVAKEEEPTPIAEGLELELRTGDAAYAVPRRTYRVPYPNMLAGRSTGCPFTPVELVELNPRSLDQIAERLQTIYGWKPKAYNDDGSVKMDEAVLADLDYPPMALVREHILVQKRIAQLAEGKEAWLKHARAGRVHGRVFATGTRTSRCSHSKPNLGQVPTVDAPYGMECRGLFRPTRPGWVQIGADASGIELRMLAHRLAFWDRGAFAEILLKGDPHREWMKATAIYFRKNQKTCTYAFLYGAGDAKLGKIRLVDWNEAWEHVLDEHGKLKYVGPGNGLAKEKPPSAKFEEALGADARSGLMRHVAGLDELTKLLQKKFRQRWLRGIDGRVIPVETQHGALNDLLQSDAGIAMKHAKIVVVELLAEQGLELGRDYAFMLNVHDEWQFEAPPENAEIVGQTAVRAITTTGERLGVRIRLDGEYKIGNTWAETH
jgi:DNA polymerase-1